MKFLPNFCDRSCAASRAIVSVLPPGPNGTMMVTGRVGQSAARAGSVPTARAKSADSMRSEKSRRGIFHISMVDRRRAAMPVPRSCQCRVGGFVVLPPVEMVLFGLLLIVGDATVVL